MGTAISNWWGTGNAGGDIQTGGTSVPITLAKVPETISFLVFLKVVLIQNHWT
jgi:hypothetical protein